MSEFQAVTTEVMFAGDAYETLPVEEGDKLPRIQLWRDKSKQPSGVVVSDRIFSGEYVNIDFRNGHTYGTRQMAK